MKKSKIKHWKLGANAKQQHFTSSIVSSTSAITGGGERRLAGTKTQAVPSSESTSLSGSSWSSSCVSSSSSLYCNWEARSVTSLGFLDSWADCCFDVRPLLVEHLGLDFRLDAAVSTDEAAGASECSASLAEYVRGLVGLGILPYLDTKIHHTYLWKSWLKQYNFDSDLTHCCSRLMAIN